MESRLTFHESVTTEAWQYKIRISEKEKYETGGLPKFYEQLDLSLKKAIVKEVQRSTAQKIILQYEWLGDMAITNKYYGIFFGNYCAGVICINTNGVCVGNSKQFGIPDSKTSYFARGACVFWAPVGTASKLLSFACKLEAKRGAYVCIGFADTDAGEYGTVYQASNWLCLGKQKNASYQFAKGNKIIDSRSISQKATNAGISISSYETQLKKWGFARQSTNKKYVYVNVVASDNTIRNRILAKIKDRISEYPKRNAVIV